MDEIDAGFDFYAPQTLVTPDGRIVMTAWMNMWGRSYPTAKDGWVGANILPRELTLEGGCLRQNPVREIENYRTNLVSHLNCMIEDNECVSFDGVFGQTIELLLSVDLLDSGVFGLKFFAGEKHETLLYYERKNGLIVFDRSNSGESVDISPSEKHYGDGIRKVKIIVSDNILTFRIFLDNCSVEAFFQDGEQVLTSTLFPDVNDTEVYFFTLGGKALIKSLTKYDIK
jgi:beta-fructofuranosidase